MCDHEGTKVYAPYVLASNPPQYPCRPSLSIAFQGGSMTPKKLQALCREWQGVLRLRDWDVKVSVRRARDFSAENVAGECVWILPNKSAVIRILDPVDYDPDIAWEQDQEKTLVHELLHLHIAPFVPERGSLEYVAHEQAIESLAKALVSLKRRK